MFTVWLLLCPPGGRKVKYVAINDVMAEAGRMVEDEDQFSLDEDSDSGKSLFRSSLIRDRSAKCTIKQLEH